MKHRLVINDMSRDEMQDYLLSTGFEIPTVEPVAPLQMPPRYTGPRYLVTLTGVQVHPDYAAYLQARDAAASAYQADLERQREEIADIQALLQATFTGMETLERVGTNPDGTAKWEWVLKIPPLYSFYQCALVFAGPKRPTDVIGFICDGYFGS